MSGIYTRSKYDYCNNVRTVEISTKPGNLVLTTPQELDDMCYSLNGPRNTRTLNSNNLGVNFSGAIDVESNLIGLGYPLSRCYENNTLVEKDTNLNNTYNQLQKKIPKECNDFLDNNYTRLEPQQRISELPYNRYDFAIINPQEFVFNGFSDNNTIGNNRGGSSTRYESKLIVDQQNKKFRELSSSYTNKIAAVNTPNV